MVPSRGHAWRSCRVQLCGAVLLGATLPEAGRLCQVPITECAVGTGCHMPGSSLRPMTIIGSRVRRLCAASGAPIVQVWTPGLVSAVVLCPRRYPA